MMWPKWKGFHSYICQCACIAAVNVVLGVFFVCLTTKTEPNKKQQHIEKETQSQRKRNHIKDYIKEKINIRSNKNVDKKEALARGRIQLKR